MRLRRAVLLAAISLGCSGETGLLIEVTTDGSTGPIEELSFSIGVFEGDLLVADRDASVQNVNVAGRDFEMDPYRVLVHASTMPAEAVAAVFGSTGGSQVAFGAFDQPQPFVEGRVLLRRLVLSGSYNAQKTNTGCVLWATPNGLLTIGAP